jgi:N-methylhydantoinase A
VSGIGPITRPELREQPVGDGDVAAARTGTRAVGFDDTAVPTDVFARELLRPGAVVTGPAIIEEYGSTIPVHPGFAARVDPYLNLVVTRA